MAVAVVAKGEEAKKKLEERGITPGKITAEITRRKSGESKRVTTTPEGTITRVEEKIKTPTGTTKKTTFIKPTKQQETVAVDKKAVQTLTQQLSREGITTAEQFVEGIKSGKIKTTKEGELIVRRPQSESLFEQSRRVSYISPNNYLLVRKQQTLPEKETITPKQERRLERFERRIELSSERQKRFQESQGFKNIQETARFLTFGGRKTYEERSFVGKTAETVTTGLLSWPIMIGGAAVSVGEKAAATVEGLTIKPARKEVIKEYKRTATSPEFKRTFDPRTPEGLSTYISAGIFTKVGGKPTRTPATRIVSRIQRSRVEVKAPTFTVPKTETTTTFVPIAKEVTVGRGVAKSVVETIAFKRQAPGFEVPRSRSIFETRTSERQLALKPGGKDPFVDRGVTTPVDVIISPLQRAQRAPSQTRLTEFGLKDPVSPEARYLSMYREQQARQLSARETQYTVPEFGTKVTEKGFIELNIPKPRFTGLGRRGQAQTIFGRRGYKNPFQDYFTLKVPKPSFTPQTFVARTPVAGRVYRPGVVYPAITKSFRTTTPSFKPLSLASFDAKSLSIGDERIITPRFDTKPIISTKARESLVTSYAYSYRSPQILITSFAPQSTIISPQKTFSTFSRSSRVTRSRSKRRLPFDIPSFDKPLTKGFTLEVRRGGVFKKVGSFKDLSVAVGRGREVVEGTAAASFRIKKGERLQDVSGYLSGRFRKAKSDPFVFVERKKYRISTGGELREITAKGISASKKVKGLSL